MIQYLVSNHPVERFGFNDINMAVEQFFEVEFEAADVQKAPLGLELNEKIDVAVRRCIATGKRTEHTDIARAVFGGDL